MTCSEAAELIYQFCEKKPSSKEIRAMRRHVGICQRCKEFIEGLGKRFELGDSNVSCGEIPDELFEALSRIMRSLDHA